MKFDRLLMFNIIAIVIPVLATFNLKAESKNNVFYTGVSAHYNINDKDGDLTEKLGSSVSLGYLFTPKWGIESIYGNYGKNLEGKNVYAYQIKGLYLYPLDSDFTLYMGVGSYFYDSEINPAAVIGVKKRLDEKTSAQFNYEYLYNGYINDDIYSLSVGINFYF
ncbi:porin family protein [Vibrio metschnikovii]|uniref:porin family protein n=1 Tax=Vibrio metschnikovii TaxID=28172 RepID=UPI001C2F96D0|nr:porin family protein [Vibrio metschnikovii]